MRGGGGGNKRVLYTKKKKESSEPAELSNSSEEHTGVKGISLEQKGDKEEVLEEGYKEEAFP